MIYISLTCVVFLCKGTSGQSLPPLDQVILKSISCGTNRLSVYDDVSKIVIEVYDFQNNVNTSFLIDKGADTIIKSAYFDPEQCIQIFVPGVFVLKTPKDNALCAFSKMTCNSGKRPLVLFINHAAYTKRSLDVAVDYALSIGKKTGELISKILNNKVSRDNIDVIGHSLGGPIVGYIGESVKNVTGQLLKRIYAIDDAGPCFDNYPIAQLKSGQAEKVVNFLCNSNGEGTTLKLADYTLTAGNGKYQTVMPCTGGDSKGALTNLMSTQCSHTVCVGIALNPIISKKGWNATKCDSYDEYKQGLCASNPKMEAGYYLPITAPPGQYFFDPSPFLDCSFKTELDAFV